MKVYRLSKMKYAKDLSGNGARIAGGRWNKKGIAIIYTSESRALCAVEVLVHMKPEAVPADYAITTIEIPDNSIANLLKLPRNWNQFPYNKATQTVGENFIKNDSLCLMVPSSVVRGEHNILINPNHTRKKDIKIIKVEPFTFDNRLFK